MSDEIIEVSRFVKSVWWLVLLRGIFAIALGVLAFVWPVATAVAFVWVFAIYAIVDGVVNIVQAIATRRTDRTWSWLLTIGIVGVVAGAVAFVFTTATAAILILALLWIVAIWAIFAGIAGIPAAASLASGAPKVLGLGLAVLSMAFGVMLAVMLVVNPAGAGIGLIYVIGVYAVLAGIVLLVIALTARAAANALLAPGGSNASRVE